MFGSADLCVADRATRDAMHRAEQAAEAAARQRPESCYYRLAWDRRLLGWALSYDGQMWAFISAYLPGRPPMDAKAARAWADGLLKHPQPWQPDGAAWRAVPAP